MRVPAYYEHETYYESFLLDHVIQEANDVRALCRTIL